METVKWIAGISLVIAFFVLAISNSLAVVTYLRRRQHVSAVPLLGGLAGLGACLILPVEGVRPFWWLPLLVDYGTLPLFVFFFASRIAASIRGDHAG